MVKANYLSKYPINKVKFFFREIQIKSKSASKRLVRLSSKFVQLLFPN